MPKRLALASFYTLGLLAGFLFSILLVFMYWFGKVDIIFVLGLTIAFNFFLWLLGPYLTDLVHKIFYKAKFYKWQEFAAAFPEPAGFVSRVATQYKIKLPKVRLIEDDNPTAYTYGSGDFNARLVITRGLFVYLSPQEIEAVLAHELGHIVHKDFIVMSVANTIIQLLYEISQIFMRSKSGKGKKNAAAVIGLVAYFFYLVSYYIVLYLNRMRESYADEFSAEVTGQPHLLSSALIKIGYDIVAKEDTSQSTRIMESSSTLGIMGIKSAKGVGLIAKSNNMDPQKIGKILVYDFVSPWAKLAELGATHPLIGKRLARMDELALAGGQPAMFNLPQVLAENPVDHARLWNHFATGATLYLLPYIVIGLMLLSWIGILAFAVPVTASGFFSFFLVLLGISIIIRALYKFPSTSQALPTTIYQLMSDPYASPVRGEPVLIDGTIIGKGIAGYAFSEDMMLQDNTGLMYLDYEAGVPFFGNILFAWKKVKKFLGQAAQTKGWFFRSNFHYVVIDRLQVGQESAKGYAKFWNIAGGLIVAGIGIVWWIQGSLETLLILWAPLLLLVAIIYIFLNRRNAMPVEKPVKTVLPLVPKPPAN